MRCLPLALSPQRLPDCSPQAFEVAASAGCPSRAANRPPPPHKPRPPASSARRPRAPSSGQGARS
eukprot:10009796-Alexandrium_andersonii.AAC.1